MDITFQQAKDAQLLRLDEAFSNMRNLCSGSAVKNLECREVKEAMAEIQHEVIHIFDLKRAEYVARASIALNSGGKAVE